MSSCILNVLFSLQPCLPISPLIGSWESSFLSHSDGFLLYIYLKCLICLLAKVETHFVETCNSHLCNSSDLIYVIPDNVKFTLVSQIRLSCFCMFYLFSKSLIIWSPFFLIFCPNFFFLTYIF